jgi:hypothetical protein
MVKIKLAELSSASTLVQMVCSPYGHTEIIMSAEVLTTPGLRTLVNYEAQSDALVVEKMQKGSLFS